MPEQHHCYAFECTRSVPPRLLMCLPRWRMVSRAIQRAVWATYREGQEIDKRPSSQYLIAQRMAVWCVALAERRVPGIPQRHTPEFMRGPVRVQPQLSLFDEQNIKES